jgi:hypothetical protein
MDFEEIVQRFVSVWNECDSDRRRETVEGLWSPEGRHLMGAQDAQGYDALFERVRASNQRSVIENGCLFRPATSIQALPGVVSGRSPRVISLSSAEGSTALPFRPSTMPIQTSSPLPSNMSTADMIAMTASRTTRDCSNLGRHPTGDLENNQPAVFVDATMIAISA